MTVNLAPTIISKDAKTGLTTRKYRLVIPNSADDTQVQICGNAGKPFGVCESADDDGSDANDKLEIAVLGGSQVKVSGSVAAGESCASAALGLGRTGVSGEWAIGVFEKDGVDGDIVPIIIDRHQVV